MPRRKKQTLTEMDKFLSDRLDEAKKYDFSINLVADVVDDTPMARNMEPVDALQFLNKVAETAAQWEKSFGLEEGTLVDLLENSFKHTLWV